MNIPLYVYLMMDGSEGNGNLFGIEFPPVLAADEDVTESKLDEVDKAVKQFLKIKILLE